jgi:SAM-dependent methyltransferase
MKFTGERIVPDDPEHQDLLNEHLARYVLAARYAFGRRVLDLGCGVGYGTSILAKKGAVEIVGVDNSTEAIQWARSNYSGENLTFVKGDATRTRKSWSGHFDLVVSFEVIEHLNKSESLLSTIKKALADGGMAILSTPNRARPGATDNPFHEREFTANEFEKLLLGHFENVRVFGQTTLSGQAFSLSGDDESFTRLENKTTEPEYLLAFCGKIGAVESLIYETPSLRAIESLHEHLVELDQSVEEKDDRILDLQHQLKTASTWAKSSNEKVDHLEQKLENRDIDLVNAQRKIERVESSFGYRIQTKLKPVFSAFPVAGKAVTRFFFGRLTQH